jgi:hypothetical protein
LPRSAHSRCHHRFCGSAAWDGDVKQKARPGRKSQRVAHVLPRPAAAMLLDGVSYGVNAALQARSHEQRLHRCQAPERERDVSSPPLVLRLGARHDWVAGGRPVNHTYRP